MKALMSKDSIQKMTWLTYGNQLHTYIGDDIPKEYGGNSASLKERGLTPKYDSSGVETNGEAKKTEVDGATGKKSAEGTPLDAGASTATA